MESALPSMMVARKAGKKVSHESCGVGSTLAVARGFGAAVDRVVLGRRHGAEVVRIVALDALYERDAEAGGEKGSSP